MFRIILLIFVFLYFSWNFFYWFIINYIPFKNAQSINLYNTYKVFEESSFSWFMADETLSGTNIDVWFWNVKINKYSITSSLSGILLTLPYRSWHRHWEQIEIIVPIINDLWDTALNDNAYSWISLKYKNNLIKSWEHHLLYWIDYSQVNSIDEATNNLLIQDNHNIFLNKLYLIKKDNLNYIIR